MSNKSPKTVITNTDQLASIADDVLVRSQAGKLSKNTILNIIAANIVGSKLNWGGLKSLENPVYGIGMSYEDISEAPSPTNSDVQGEPFILNGEYFVFSKNMRISLYVTFLPILQSLLHEEHIYMSGTTISSTHEGVEISKDCHKKPVHLSNVEYDELVKFIKSNRDEIFSLIISDPMGGNIYDAFDDMWDQHGSDLLVDVKQQHHAAVSLYENMTQEDKRVNSETILKNAIWDYLATRHRSDRENDSFSYDDYELVTEEIQDCGAMFISDAMVDHFRDIKSKIDEKLSLSRKPIGPDVIVDGEVKRNVIDLLPGDRVDLENDAFADPEGYAGGHGHPGFASEFSIVEMVELETDDCVLVYFEGHNPIGFPLSHSVGVDGEQKRAAYLMKNKELNDNTGRMEYITYTHGGEEVSKFIGLAEDARRIMVNGRMTALSPMDLRRVQNGK